MIGRIAFRSRKEEPPMPARKQFQTSLTVTDEIRELLDKAKAREVTEEELREQRISFAYGNAPESDLITKETVRVASKQIRLTQE